LYQSDNRVGTSLGEYHNTREEKRREEKRRENFFMAFGLSYPEGTFRDTDLGK
jgi:hypothetical protein